MRRRLPDPLTPVRHKRATPRRRRRPRGKAWNLGMGIFFFIVGVIGVLIPVMPQIPFFIMSLLFFSLVFPPIRRRIRAFLRGHPRVAHAYKRWRDKARRKRQAIIRREKELFSHLRHHGEL